MSRALGLTSGEVSIINKFSFIHSSFVQLLDFYYVLDTVVKAVGVAKGTQTQLPVI